MKINLPSVSIKEKIVSTIVFVLMFGLVAYASIGYMSDPVLEAYPKVKILLIANYVCLAIFLIMFIIALIFTPTKRGKS